MAGLTGGIASKTQKKAMAGHRKFFLIIFLVDRFSFAMVSINR
jgi:hypothetical protein